MAKVARMARERRTRMAVWGDAIKLIVGIVNFGQSRNEWTCIKNIDGDLC